MLFRFYLLSLVIIIGSNLLNLNTGTPVSNTKGGNDRKNTIEWSHLISKRATDRKNAAAGLRRVYGNHVDDDDDNEAEDPDDMIDWHLLSADHTDDLKDALRYRRKRAISSYMNLASSQIDRHRSANNHRQRMRQPIFRSAYIQKEAQLQHQHPQQHNKFINKKHWRSKRGLVINDDDSDNDVNGQDLNSDSDHDAGDRHQLEQLSDEELKQLAELIYQMQLLNEKGAAGDERGYSYPDEIFRGHPSLHGIDPTTSNPVRLRQYRRTGGVDKRKMKKRSLEPTYYGYRTSPDRALPREVVWLRPASSLDGDTSGESPPVGQIGTIVGPYSYEPAFYGASTLLDATESASRRRLDETELEKRIVSLARYLNNNRARRRRR